MYNYPKMLQDAKKFAGLNPSQQALAKSIAKSKVAPGGKAGYNQLINMEAYKAAEQLGFYKKAAPAQTAPKKAEPATTSSAKTQTEVEVNPETKDLQDQTADLLEEIEQLKKDIVDPQTIIDQYVATQGKVKEQQQATAAAQYANKAMSGLAPTLQIGTGAGAPMKTGTSAFKIKKQKTGATSTMNPLNIGSSSSLNV